jgi:hypothetical protein
MLLVDAIIELLAAAGIALLESLGVRKGDRNEQWAFRPWLAAVLVLSFVGAIGFALLVAWIFF